MITLKSGLGSLLIGEFWLTTLSQEARARLFGNQAMVIVDLSFRVVATGPISADHGYRLYSSLSRLVPLIHRTNDVAIHPIRGRLVGNRLMSLTPQSRLVIRTPHELVPSLLPLTGKVVVLGGTRLQLGVPEVRALVPAASLRSRLVVIKIKESPSAADLTVDVFAAALRQQLDALGVRREIDLRLGKRRSLRIKDKEIVGYEVILSQLQPEESLSIQERGLGGRHHMGCGIFVPVSR